jgi:hypothetical protein
MTGENIAAFLVVILFLGTGIAIAVSISWFDHRTRTRALDVLRVYAERGEEPPQSVLQALTSVSGWARKADAAENRDRIGRPRTRGGFLAHAAANTIFAAGLSGLAWWRISASGQPGTGGIVAILAALFFAASVAAQLVGAHYAPDR